MPDNYPTMTFKPMLSGGVTITPNVIVSEFLGGFISQSQNGRKAVIREFSLVQPLDSDAEYVTLEDFIISHTASVFTIEYLDRDKSGTTTMNVVFNGAISYSTDGGKSEMVIPLKEAQ